MPMVASLITDHLQENNLSPQDVEQYWLHQANINMNTYVVKKLLGDDFPPERAPNVLDEYANTGSAGSLIAFHKYNHLKPGQKGIICSFGAGYSICSILVERE
jgi:beta-ketodecanoyl-[acyl-carrier-protein] synthase